MSPWPVWLSAALVWAQLAPKSLPPWLVPYPGAEVKLSSTANTLNAAYTAGAKAADVIAHLRANFASAGLPFNPNPNGMGTSIRATTPECELLITLREAAPGTHVLISCTDRNGQTQRSGQPVYPGSPVKRSFYSDDAPPLSWPSWLGSHGTTGALQPVEREASGETYLEGRYQTSTPMVELHRFYRNLVEANGYRIVTSQVTTSQSVRGNIVLPEPYGLVEACRSADGAASGPRTCVKAVISGNHSNGPVTVNLTVRARRSYGQR